jgi:hypothetical protein
MRLMRNILMFIIFCLGSLSAQTFIGKINPVPEDKPFGISNGDTVKILAVLADFQQDKDEATYGNGKFGSMYSKSYGTAILDPLPHDKNYFEEHLEFVKNYYRKVSKNKVNISYEVIPDIFTVSKTMRNYSPASNSNDLSPLGNFTKEVWQSVSSAYPNIKYSDYNVFIIFHAGVGRDVSITGSFGNEKDLPSLYLSDKAFRTIFNNDLTGLPQNADGKYNSILIPETESREESGLGGTALLELTINGILVSSVASYMGLPDLFDTNTGLSAIGRFGLMDGQAIFAYSGAFPPEPSAWEKIFLGWEKPFEVGIENKTYNIYSDIAASASDTTIIKVPINSSEYFLIENRIRDVNKDGAKITYYENNELKTKTFSKDSSGFYSWNVDSLSGVITDVDEYDWALPGNGIVIWHIDDNVINAKLADNKINTDKLHRGIDVEEADGIQDIGEKFTTIFGDQVVGEGSADDFWFKDNKSKLYKNYFTDNTEPSTKSYSGANSLISITNFSSIGNKMSFNVSWGDSLIKPVLDRTIYIPNIYNYPSLLCNNENPKNFYILSGGTLLRFDTAGNLIDSTEHFSGSRPAIIFENNIEIVVGVGNNRLNVFMNDGINKKYISQDIDSLCGTDHSIYWFPAIEKSNSGNSKVVLSTWDGYLLYFTLGNITSDNPSFIKSQKYCNDIIYRILLAPEYTVVLANIDKSGSEVKYYLADSTGVYNFQTNMPIWDAALTKNQNGNYNVILDKQGKELCVLDKDNIIKEIIPTISVKDFRIEKIGLADIKSDGNNYLTFSNGDNLEIINLTGSSANNFPFTDPMSVGFDYSNLLVDFSGDKSSEIIISTRDGRIFAIDGGSGKVVEGFPISVGEELIAPPVFFNNNGRASLAALTKSKHLYVWNISLSEGKPYWIAQYGDNLNTSFVPAAGSSNEIKTFFPKERAYNYPNPVYDGITNIRYFVGEDSKINIKIFDLAGDFVAELNDFAKGGFDNETVWNVKDIQSGVYLARIEAVSSSGKTENNTIKIAVIK